MNLPAKIVAALLALVVALGVGYRLGMDVKQGQWDAAKVAQAQAEKAALSAAAEAIARIEVRHQTIVQKVRHEITKEPVFRDCLLPSSAVGLLNAAASGDPAPAGGE